MLHEHARRYHYYDLLTRGLQNICMTMKSLAREFSGQVTSSWRSSQIDIKESCVLDFSTRQPLPFTDIMSRSSSLPKGRSLIASVKGLRRNLSEHQAGAQLDY